MPPSTPSKPRVIAFGCCAAFILFAPAYKQLFAGDAPLPRWEMFGATALDVYGVKLEAQIGDGPRHAIDRFEVLGYADPQQAPSAVRLITKESEAANLAQRLCTHLGPDAKVYMRLQAAKREGWSVINDGSQDVCKR